MKYFKVQYTFEQRVHEEFLYAIDEWAAAHVMVQFLLSPEAKIISIEEATFDDD